MNLKEIRKRQGLSVPKLVSISGVPRRTIQQIEKTNKCMMDTALKLAAALNVTLDDLCGTKKNENGNAVERRIIMILENMVYVDDEINEQINEVIGNDDSKIERYNSFGTVPADKYNE
ncbi:MAG: helix-turn-helix domain-containing protein, partial [Lachnoclostridium sp.]|nr:helix-turn-helix domain-containing protein [Lachnoclostridium sp.]